MHDSIPNSQLEVYAVSECPQCRVKERGEVYTTLLTMNECPQCRVKERGEVYTTLLTFSLALSIFKIT